MKNLYIDTAEHMDYVRHIAKNIGYGQEEESPSAPEPMTLPAPAVEPATTPEPRVTPFSPTIQPETTPKG